MTDGRQNWDDFLKESYTYPEGLTDVESRLIKRITKNHKKRKAVFGSLSAIAAALLFVVLVNTNTAFASSISELPLLGSLVEFVQFDKSLSSAIENDYVQEVDLTAWDGQEQLSLPYAIADEKNLVLFFQLPKNFALKPNQWAQINLQEMTNGITGEKIEGFCSGSSSLSAEEKENSNGFLQQNYHFTEGKLPQSINLKINVEIEDPLNSYDTRIEDDTLENYDREDDLGNDALEDNLRASVKSVGTFTFDIDFEEFAAPIIYEFHKNYTIENQQIVLEEMRVYPTGTEVSFTFPEENSAWIKGLDLAVAQDGEVILKGKNGLSATGDDKQKSIFIESNYFDKPKEQELLIQGIRLLNKDEEYITVNLDQKTITPSVSGIKLANVTKRNGKAMLEFSTKISAGDCFGMFAFNYHDLEGNSYELQHEGTSANDSLMETRITVVYPQDGKLIFQRSLTPEQILHEPIRIKLPVQN